MLIRSTTILRRCRTEEAAKMTRRMNTILLFVSVILFTLATAVCHRAWSYHISTWRLLSQQWALNCSMLFEALDFSGGALLYYLMPAHPKLVAQIAITICECIIADLFVVGPALCMVVVAQQFKLGSVIGFTSFGDEINGSLASRSYVAWGCLACHISRNLRHQGLTKTFSRRCYSLPWSFRQTSRWKLCDNSWNLHSFYRFRGVRCLT